MKKLLILNLCKIYYDEIKNGLKKEELREAKPYWVKRLENKKYDYIIIRCGYPKKNDKSKEMYFKYNGYTKKRTRHEHFGYKDLLVYSIDLSERIENLDY